MHNRDLKYILVSTQSIEAGVDVSFDFVIRDFSTLDSIEQVRGRCNRSRELNRKDSNKKGNIYLINIKDNKRSLYEYIYDSHEIKSRITETKNILNNNLNYNYYDILKYYNAVSSNINRLTDDYENNFIFSDRDNIKNWNKMEYSRLQNKKLGISIIDNELNQYSIFIPIKMNIFSDSIKDENVKNQIFSKINIEEMSLPQLEQLYLLHKDKFIFSFNELTFLKNRNKNSSLLKGNFIIGKKLIEYYADILKNQENDFEKSKIFKKEFSSILNKFIINISLNDKDLESELEEFEKLYYFYVMPEELIGNDEYSFYSLNEGFNYDPIVSKLY